MYPPKSMPMQAPGMAVPPVNRFASDLLRLNCVSRYLGRNTINPELRNAAF
jgi:hypothetical protein